MDLFIRRLAAELSHLKKKIIKSSVNNSTLLIKDTSQDDTDQPYVTDKLLFSFICITARSIQPHVQDTDTA